MASDPFRHPFRVFQRNKKGCLAGATLLAMISFLFLGVIIQMLGGQGGGSGQQIETIAECRQFGKITSRELYSLNEEHEAFRRFCIILYQNLADPTNEEKMNAMRGLEVFVNQAAVRRSSETLINTWLITQYAQAEGLKPSWDDIKQLLTDLTGGYLSDAIYNETLKSAGISQTTLEYLFGKYMVESQAVERFTLPLVPISPATRWDWYQRLYRQVAIEAACVPVDKYIAQVSEPSERQLNEFFEQYKSRRYNPASAEAGLISATELAFQYVSAVPNQKMLDSIAEEAMKEYYEANKDALYRKPVKPLTDLPNMGMTTPFPTPLSAPPSVTPNVTPNVTVTESESTPAETPKVEEPKADEPKVEEPKVEEKPAEEKPTEKPEEKPAEAQPETSLLNGAAMRFVKFQNEEAKVEEPKAEEPKPEAPKVEEPKAEAEAPKAETPVDISILYRPFDEVKEEIRRTLAAEKAAQGLPKIQAKMKEYAQVYNMAIEQQQAPPAMPDLSAIVAEQGLELKTVPVGDVYAALKSDFAKGLYERERLVGLFREAAMLFESEIFQGSGNQVLLWVTELKMSKRPEKLSDVREMAVKQWKVIEARTLAMREAEKLAAEAQSAGKPLAEVFAGKDIPVVETETFTWKSYGSVHPLMAVMNRIPPQLGEVREKGVTVGDAMVLNKVIAFAGSDFMEKVFSLPVNGVGAAFNQPQSAAYVVRVVSSNPADEVLWERFQQSFVLEYLYAGQPDLRAEAFAAWLEDLRKKTGFRWVNRPEMNEE